MSDESTNIPGYTDYTIDRSGNVRCNGEIKKPWLGKDGYYSISLKNPITNKYDPKRMKDLIAKAYLPNDDPSRKKIVGFKNNNGTNHNLDNLIWRTKKEHAVHAASKPIDTSDTRECKLCNKILPMINFPFDHPNHDTGEEGHRRHHCQECISKKKSIRKRTPEQNLKQKDKALKKNYNITIEQFNDMLKAQDEKCVTCSVDISRKGHSNVDHCHSTQKVRGILCPNCNKALGMVGDSIAILQSLVAYLQKHSATPTIVKMPALVKRVKPVKTGEQHGNSGKVHSETTKTIIANTKKAEAVKKYEDRFIINLNEWEKNPKGEKEKKWRFSTSKKNREGTLPQNYITMLNNTPGWTFSKQGTPHSTNSRIQDTD